MCTLPDLTRLDIELRPHELDDGTSPNELVAAQYPFFITRGELFGVIDVRRPGWARTPALMIAVAHGVDQLFVDDDFSAAAEANAPTVMLYRSGDEIVGRDLPRLRIPEGSTSSAARRTQESGLTAGFS